MRFTFIDSFAFMASGLETLSNNLNHDDKKQTLKFLSQYNLTEEQTKRILRKGVFPYSWFDDIKKL